MEGQPQIRLLEVIYKFEVRIPTRAPVKRLTKWLADVMEVVRKICAKNEDPHFIIDDVRAHEDALAKLHPNNHRVDAKIRQSLRLLAKRGHLKPGEKRGHYELLHG